MAREVLLDLFLHLGGQLDPRLLAEADLDDLRVGDADADVEARVVALGLEQVAAHRRREDAQVGDAHAGRGQAGEHRPLDHPAGRRRLPARDHPRAALERGAERGGQADRGLGRQVDVDEPGDAVLAEQTRGRPRLPDQALVDLRAGLDLFVREDPNGREDRALSAKRYLVAERRALLHVDVRADVAVTAHHCAFDAGATADVGRRVDDRALGVRPLEQRHARREHRIRADGGVRGDPAVVAEQGRPFDRGEVVDVHPLPQPDVPAQLDPGDVQAHALVERVEVRLPELVEVADVLPVAVEHVPVQRPPHLEQQREQLLGEVVRPVVGDVPQDLGLEHVDPGVDRVREDLAPGRLLEEALDPAVLVGDDDAELERVVDRLEADRDRGLALLVDAHDLGQVDVGERVAGDDEEGVVELVARVPDRAGGAERRFLDGVLDRDPEPLAVAEVAADRLRHERHGHDHLVEAVLLEQLDDVLHARLADDRHHRLRLVGRQRAQARALAAGHHDRLHAVFTSRRALTR